MASYELSMTDHPDYLYVHARGIRTQQVVVLMAKEILSTSHERGFARVLVDVREMPGQLRAVEAYNIGTDDFPRLWDIADGIRRSAHCTA